MQGITSRLLFLSLSTEEAATIAYLCDAPLPGCPRPAGHPTQKELEDIAVQMRLAKYPSPEKWARNRHASSRKDGLFTAADWYPRLGGPGRTLSNHLAAVHHRLLEFLSITLRRSS